ncbi:hypothetical protein [Chitinophaga niabensis]|uniref:SMODS-associating 2TM beta-strand rich effector domain-containing protein n=1 Tax=Chitinophaga niabensis TaxID=536979 RepID=A0A1N6KES9_9BACT|nr:hypothetical protein [Chitinophaga niabensis]SIO55075.1 hypothetical protein SAMN04488055_5719 [Chitinophaga niabensis]
MKPSVKLHSFAIAISTVIVFTIWVQINELGTINNYLKIILGGLISLGVYRAMVSLIITATKNSTWFKKKFLGKYYMGGTWVGFYIGFLGKERFIIERFEQGIDGLVIRGKSFDELSKYHAAWFSTSVNIDVEKGRIMYMYECLPINAQTNNDGIASFGFIRDDEDTAPTQISGFSADMHLGKRVRAFEIKVSDRCDYKEDEALKRAKEVFLEKKDLF